MARAGAADLARARLRPAADLSAPDLIKQHPKYREWLSIVGTEWNLYVATHEMSFSTEAQRAAVIRELAREYRPEFKQGSAQPAHADARPGHAPVE
jgi:hypothetical protein